MAASVPLGSRVSLCRPGDCGRVSARVADDPILAARQRLFRQIVARQSTVADRTSAHRTVPQRLATTPGRPAIRQADGFSDCHGDDEPDAVALPFRLAGSSGDSRILRDRVDGHCPPAGNPRTSARDKYRRLSPVSAEVGVVIPTSFFS